jgi:hypothetical protein
MNGLFPVFHKSFHRSDGIQYGRLSPIVVGDFKPSVILIHKKPNYIM